MEDRSNEEFNPPMQRRSEETLARILTATRSLLEMAVFEDVTISQIAAGAGCSVGPVYGRFKNKDAILPHLLEMHYAEMEEELGITFDSEKWSDVPLNKRADAAIDFLVSTAQQQPGMIRTLALRNYQRPDSIPPSIRAAAKRMLTCLYEFLLDGSSGLEFSDKKIRLEVGLLMVSAAIRERMVLVGATQATTLSISDEDFASELKHAFLAYLISPQGQ